MYVHKEEIVQTSSKHWKAGLAVTSTGPSSWCNRGAMAQIAGSISRLRDYLSSPSLIAVVSSEPARNQIKTWTSFALSPFRKLPELKMESVSRKRSHQTTCRPRLHAVIMRAKTFHGLIHAWLTKQPGQSARTYITRCSCCNKNGRIAENLKLWRGHSATHIAGKAKT